MGKGSGSTRTQSAKKPAVDYVTTPQWDGVVNSIAKGDSIDYDVWQELSNNQRELLLMEAGFTGLTADDFSDAQLYYSQSKDEFVSLLADDLSNIAGGYDIDDSVSWTIGYADGSRKYLNGTGEDDLSGTFGVTTKQSYSTQKSKVASQLTDNKIAFILRTDGYDQPRYYVSKKNNGISQLKKYGGFEEWKNGRGEKKRDYIQDDWV